MSDSLDVGWVEHNADAVAHSLWWQVGGELCADDARVTMGARQRVRLGQKQFEFILIKHLPGDLAPDGSGAVGLAIWSA